MNSTRGIFLSLEGLDGCGKSTQARLLAEHLQSLGHNVLLTREPGGTALGQEIRRLLLHPDIETPVPAAELLLYLADRIQHLQTRILPALASGTHVISDRFHDSTVAYQGGGRQLDLRFLQSIVHEQIAPHSPDRTFVLQLPVPLAQQRLTQRAQHKNSEAPTRFDQESTAFFQRVATSFQTLVEQHSERCRAIDATPSIEAVHNAILAQLPEVFLA
jgi:dTMP kinase